MRSGFVLVLCHICVLNVDHTYAYDSALHTSNVTFGAAPDIIDSYPLLMVDSKCYKGLCEPFEVCYEELDLDSQETFAMCKCKEDDARCDDRVYPRPGSNFNALSAEKFAIQQLGLKRSHEGQRSKLGVNRRLSRNSCLRTCPQHSVCLSVRGHEICVPKRTCDKESKPCVNGGTCVSAPFGGSVCECLRNYTGDRCEFDMSICDTTSPCENGGKCTVVSRKSQCNCTVGYGGNRCQVRTLEKNPCMSNPCIHGYCRHSGRDKIFCECKAGWSGELCNVSLDPCLLNPCPSGHSCVPMLNSSRSGYRCMVNPDPCSPNPCRGDCQCKESCKHEGGYFCYGGSGLLGKNCDIPAPNIVCGGDTIHVKVDSRIVDEYSGGRPGFQMFMSRSYKISDSVECKATTQNGFHNFSVPLPFTTCGVVATEGDNVTHVSGKIWINRLIGTAEMAIPVVDFVCRYQRQYRVMTSLVPATDSPPTVTENGELNGTANIHLCKSGASCPGPCPPKLSLNAGALYTVNERVHVRIMPSVKGVELRLNDLFLSCSPEHSQLPPEMIDLFRDGCMPSSWRPYFGTRAKNSGGGVCLSFRTPHLRKCTEFYIHANLKSCYSGCDVAYTQCEGRRRRKRSSSSESSQVFGPIYILDVKDGELESVLYPGDVDSKESTVIAFENGESNTDVALAVSVSMAFGLVVVVLGLLAAHNCHYINRGRQQ